MRILIDMGTGFEWRGADGERAAVDREEFRSLVCSRQWNSDYGAADPGESLAAGQRVYLFKFPSKPGRVCRLVSLDWWAIHSERARRAEENRKAKAARVERAEIRRAAPVARRPLAGSRAPRL